MKNSYRSAHSVGGSRPGAKPENTFHRRVRDQELPFGIRHHHAVPHASQNRVDDSGLLVQACSDRSSASARSRNACSASAIPADLRPDGILQTCSNCSATAKLD